MPETLDVANFCQDAGIESVEMTVGATLPDGSKASEVIIVPNLRPGSVRDKSGEMTEEALEQAVEFFGDFVRARYPEREGDASHWQVGDALNAGLRSTLRNEKAAELKGSTGNPVLRQTKRDMNNANEEQMEKIRAILAGG